MNRQPAARWVSESSNRTHGQLTTTRSSRATGRQHRLTTARQRCTRHNSGQHRHDSHEPRRQPAISTHEDSSIAAITDSTNTQPTPQPPQPVQPALAADSVGLPAGFVDAGENWKVRRGRWALGDAHASYEQQSVEDQCAATHHRQATWRPESFIEQSQMAGEDLLLNTVCGVGVSSGRRIGIERAVSTTNVVAVAVVDLHSYEMSCRIGFITVMPLMSCSYHESWSHHIVRLVIVCSM